MISEQSVTKKLDQYNSLQCVPHTPLFPSDSISVFCPQGRNARTDSSASALGAWIPVYPNPFSP